MAANMDNGSNDDLNVYPSIDSLAEVRVLTSNYAAQYGPQRLGHDRSLRPSQAD